MPLYYFHFYNDEVLLDHSGKELRDQTAARAAAIEGISELIAENIAAGKPVELTDRIEIALDHDRVVEIIRFSDLFARGGRPLEDA